MHFVDIKMFVVKHCHWMIGSKFWKCYAYLHMHISPY